jgi:Tfp pilus assembly protein PilF
MKPLRLTKERLAAFQAEIRQRFSSDYARAKRLLAAGDYGEAAGYFQKSLKANSHTMESYQGLGICYYHLGEHEDARKFLEKAIKLDESQPVSWFYGAANLDALNRRNGAMHGYRQYLSLQHDNTEMDAFARNRLDALTQKREDDWRGQLLRVIDAIRKEIEE